MTSEQPRLPLRPAETPPPLEGEPALLDAEPLPGPGDQVYVIDAHSLIYQSFHAIPEMTGPQGQPVNAVYGFLRDVVELPQKRSVDYLLCAFDAKGPTFRQTTYADYKINRPEMPDDLRPQIELIRELLDAIRVPVLIAPGFEADDILATVAVQTAATGADCFLVTNDKDCRQLIRDRVKIYLIRKDRVLDREALEADWGIAPEQVVDFQALWGDAGDNVPGIEGIGKKTAGDLLRRYGTIEGIYEHLDEIRGPKRREALRAGRQQLEISRDLVRLRTDVPVEIDWAGARMTSWPEKVDAPRVLEWCRQLGFRRFAEQLTGVAVEDGVTWETDYRLVTSLEQLDELIEIWQHADRLSVDTETTSIHPRFAELVGISIAWDVGKACYLPLRAPAGEPVLDTDAVLQRLRPLWESTQLAKGGQNLKYDLIVLRGAGMELKNVAFDSMIADYLIDPGRRSHGLDELSRRHLQHEMIPASKLLGTGKQQRRMDEVPVADVAEYAAEDADVPLRLWDRLIDELHRAALEPLFEQLEMPLVEVLADMEYTGIHVDREQLEALQVEFGERLDQLREEIQQLAGSPFNVDSPSQLAAVLFDRLGLPSVKKTKTGRSTDVDVLKQLAPLHPLPEKMITYRQFAKLKNSYVDTLPQLVHPETGRIHTSFRQAVAATGRLSSTDPNLQNIPVRTPEGRAIRSAFCVESDDWIFLSADYSQIELRVLAELSGDAGLQQAFHDGLDIHTQVAAEVFGVPVEEVQPEQRRRAKAINFGIIYGQSPFGLSRALGITRAEAAAFIEAYFARFPAVSRFIDETLEDCRRRGYVTTWLGRRRHIQGIRGAEERAGATQRNLPERIAVNTVIQGTAADLIKQAMLDVWKELRRTAPAARLLLQIHDELLLEVPRAELAVVERLVTHHMTSVVSWNVPLKVDLKRGSNWAECE